MIEIGMNGVSINFGFKQILTGVDVEIYTGDKIGIVGENGCGKSTIMKMLAGKLTPDTGGVFIRKGAAVGYLEQIPTLEPEGVCVRQVLEQSQQAIQALAGRMGELENAMAQDCSSAEMERLIKQYAAAQEQFISAGGYEAEEIQNKIVKMFYISDLLARPFNNLSGGQKTVVKLAALLLQEPDILLLDEPTNHLDIQALEWLENFLAKYKGTVVIISHDRYFLDKIIEKTLWLENGKGTMFQGHYSASIAERERQLLAEFEQYKNQQKKIDAMKAAIKRFRDWGNQGDNEKFFKKAKELEKRLEKMEIMDKPQLEKKKLPIAFGGGKTGNEILTINEIDLSIGDLQLLQNTELTLYKGEKVCLLGENGSGKTTLLACILEQAMAQDAGGPATPAVFTGGIRLNPSVNLGYIPQEIRFVNEKDSVLLAFRNEFGCLEGEARGILAKYFFYGDNVFKQVSMLSGGEKVLLKLAVLMQKKVNFLILDEPTNHIDIGIREMLEEALQEFNGSLLFVSHDRYFINKLATRIVAIQDLRLQSFYGNYDAYTKATLKQS